MTTLRKLVELRGWHLWPTPKQPAIRRHFLSHVTSADLGYGATVCRLVPTQIMDATVASPGVWLRAFCLQWGWTGAPCPT